MKRTIIAILAVAITLAVAAPARADVRWDKEHCSAAYETRNFAEATVYCSSAAEDFAVMAQEEHGKAQVLDVMLEAIILVQVAQSYHMIDKDDEGRLRLTTARQLFSKARTLTHDPELLGMISKGEESLSGAAF